MANVMDQYPNFRWFKLTTCGSSAGAWEDQMDRPGLDREDEDGPADRRTRPCGLWESVEHSTFKWPKVGRKSQTFRCSWCIWLGDENLLMMLGKNNYLSDVNECFLWSFWFCRGLWSSKSTQDHARNKSIDFFKLSSVIMFSPWKWTWT